MTRFTGTGSTRPARRRFLLDDGGQAVVEFALVMPILLLVVIGIIEFGRAWNTQQALADAAREGARAAVIFADTTTISDVRHAVHTIMTSVNLDTTAATVTVPACITASGRNCPRGDQATVSVSYPYTFLFLGPLMNWTSGQSTLNLGATVTMRHE